MEEYTQITLSDWIDMKTKLRQELQNVKQSFVRIGFALRKISDSRGYETDGYKNIAEFAKAEYGLEASTVSRFMAINKKYSIAGYSEQIRPEFLDFNKSQLEEMLQIPETDYTMIEPKTARKDIRNLKKFEKSDPVKTDPAGMTEEKDKWQQIIKYFCEDNLEEMRKIKKIDKENLTESIKEIVNPSGSRSYQKGIDFIMFSETKISFKRFRQNPETKSYEEFAKAVEEEINNLDLEEKLEEKVKDPEEKVEDPEEKAEELEKQKKEVEKSKEKPKTLNKTAIAPAQKKEEKPIKKEEKPPEKKIEKPVIEIEMTRKQFLNSLNEHEAAVYLSDKLKIDIEKIESFLKEKVNEKGCPSSEY